MQSTAGLFFFVNLNQFMLAYMSTLTIFNGERVVIVREQANQMYDIIPYYFARTIVETPLFVIGPLIFSAILYFLVGLEMSAEHFFKFTLVMVLQIQCALSYSYFLSAMIANGTTALMIGPIVIFPFMLLGGFFTNSSALATWLKGVQKVSPLSYGFEAVGWNEWGTDRKVNCAALDLQTVEDCMPQFLGFKYSYWECIIIMAGMVAGLRIISAFGFKFILGKFAQ